MASNETKYSDPNRLKELYDQAYANRADMMLDPFGGQASNERTARYGAIDREQSTLDQSLRSSELDAYRMIGQQQLELENQIAENRMKALRSGVTSAQLASQQLANMFAAQQGAAQVGSQMMTQRQDMFGKMAAQRTGVETGIFDQVSANKQALGTLGAQQFTAGSAWDSYMNSQSATTENIAELFKKDPYVIGGALGLEGGAIEELLKKQDKKDKKDNPAKPAPTYDPTYDPTKPGSTYDPTKNPYYRPGSRNPVLK